MQICTKFAKRKKIKKILNYVRPAPRKVNVRTPVIRNLRSYIVLRTGGAAELRLGEFESLYLQMN